ncbi:MAG: prolyl oligopeptidase family serine peptidase [Planctomycetota bacterium]
MAVPNSRRIGMIGIGVLFASITCAQTPAANDSSDHFQTMTFTRCLALPAVGRYGRDPLHIDSVQHRVATGAWRAPVAGDAVLAHDGKERAWQEFAAASDGWFRDAVFNGGGYAFVTVTAKTARVVMLDAAGHGMVYVNGEPRVGDLYSLGSVQLPIELRAGQNEFLFHVPRGQFRARLVPVETPVAMTLTDATLPDDLVDAGNQDPVGLLIVNATTATLRGLSINTGRGLISRTTFLAEIPPLSVRKALVRMPPAPPPVPRPEASRDLRFKLYGDPTGAALAECAVTLTARTAAEPHRRTFESAIDGSVQYYAVNPAQPLASPTTADASLPGLVLSLHGASVEASSQAGAYGPKDWCHIVAPTNRRPFGFDWEDWGRLDALEVLEHAALRYAHDPRRVYLTGHSMGGHGTWHLGVTYPDRFAAIAPSAGWVSFWSYSGAGSRVGQNAVDALVRRAAAPSDTLLLKRNLLEQSVYILHGTADDNVPVAQARTMTAELAGWHKDHVLHEQADAGHWWDASEAPGASCVDWPPMFEMFARRQLPLRSKVRAIEFATANPAHSSQCHWLTIEAQQKHNDVASVALRLETAQRRITGTTNNVARMSISLEALDGSAPFDIEMDGELLSAVQWCEPPGRVQLGRTREGRWAVSSAAPLSDKGPHRYGPFKHVFQRRAILVYGTRGSAAENAWALAKARYDGETFWYRGNGAFEVVPDTRFDPAAEVERNVVLYGNAATNGAWATLIGEDTPVHIGAGAFRIGVRQLDGDFAALFIRPRPKSDAALVGVVGGTTVAAMRACDRLPYFVSGVAYPDFTVFEPRLLLEGADGLVVAGYFGADWTVDGGEFAWRE